MNALECFLDFYNYSVLLGEGSVTKIILSSYHPDLEELKGELIVCFSIEVDILDLPKDIDQKFSALYGLTLKEEKQRVKEKSIKMSKKKKGEESND